MQNESELIKRYKKDNPSWFCLDLQHAGDGVPDCYFFRSPSEYRWVEFKHTDRPRLRLTRPLFRDIQLATLVLMNSMGLNVSVVLGNKDEYIEVKGELLKEKLSNLMKGPWTPKEKQGLR